MIFTTNTVLCMISSFIIIENQHLVNHISIDAPNQEATEEIDPQEDENGDGERFGHRGYQY